MKIRSSSGTSATRLAALLLLAGASACQSKPPTPAPSEEAGAPTEAAATGAAAAPTGSDQASPRVNIDDPAACAPCHQAVVDEWQRSQHARAHHSRDPIYAAMRTLRTEKQGAHIPGACAQCHSPREVVDFDSAVAQTGVSCATCHAVQSLQPTGHGAQTMVWAAEHTLLGPHDLAADASPAHNTGAAPAHLKDGQTLCLNCHNVLASEHGVATCTTGAEFAAAATGQTCVSCHMPEQPQPSGAVSRFATHRSHQFLGPSFGARNNDPAFAQSTLELSATADAGQLVVRVAHTGSHSWPSGYPGRLGQLRIRGFDAAGAAVWDPATDTQPPPALAFTRTYTDDAGNPAMAPFATRELSDTRIPANSAHEVKLALPPNVERVEVSLVHHLSPPPALERFGLANSVEHRPLVVRQTSVEVLP